VTTGPNTIKHYYANGQRIATRDKDGLKFNHADILGSASKTSNATGAEVRAIRYDPWGATQAAWGSGTAVVKYTYTGKEQDATGLYYYGARYYDPALGRFLTLDAYGGNYVYANNNPVMYIDLDGNNAIDVIKDYIDEKIFSIRKSVSELGDAVASDVSKIQSYISDEVNAASTLFKNLVATRTNDYLYKIDAAGNFLDENGTYCIQKEPYDTSVSIEDQLFVFILLMGGGLAAKPAKEVSSQVVTKLVVVDKQVVKSASEGVEASIKNLGKRGEPVVVNYVANVGKEATREAVWTTPFSFGINAYQSCTSEGGCNIADIVVNTAFDTAIGGSYGGLKGAGLKHVAEKTLRLGAAKGQRDIGLKAAIKGGIYTIGYRGFLGATKVATSLSGEAIALSVARVGSAYFHEGVRFALKPFNIWLYPSFGEWEDRW